jgi:hypothetical protein
MAKAKTPAELALEAYLDSVPVREKRAREALDAAIARDAKPPVSSPAPTPSETALKNFLEDPIRREAKAKAALEEAEAKEAAGATPPRVVTPSEKALSEFLNDPVRREEKAAKSLSEAQKAERREQAGIGGKAAFAATDAFKDVFSGIALKFAAVAAPLALLGAVLSSTTSGFGLVTKSVQLLATVLSPILLPATMLLSTALVALSEVLFTGTQGGMETFFELVIGLGIPALVGFISVVQLVVEQLGEFRDVLDKFDDAYKGSYGEALADDISDLLNRNILGISQEDLDAQHARRERGESTDAEDAVMKALKTVQQSFNQSIGPKAQISQLGDIGRAVQMAAFSADPIENQQLKVQLAIRDALNTAIAKIEARKRPGMVHTRTAEEEADRGSAGGGEGDY